jgi:hypothetical protein
VNERKTTPGPMLKAGQDAAAIYNAAMGTAMAYECDNDNHDIGCQCPGRTPDFRDLLLRDMIGYFVGKGLDRDEASKRADTLLAFVDHEAQKFT